MLSPDQNAVPADRVLFEPSPPGPGTSSVHLSEASLTRAAPASSATARRICGRHFRQHKIPKTNKNKNSR